MFIYFSPFYQRSQQITRILALKSNYSHHCKLAASFDHHQQSKCCFVTSTRTLSYKKNDEDSTKGSAPKDQEEVRNKSADQGLSRSEKLKRLKESGFVKIGGSSSSSESAKQLKKPTLTTTIDTTLKKPSVETAFKAKVEKPAPAEVIDSAVLRLAKLIDNLKAPDVSERLLKPLIDQKLSMAKSAKLKSMATDTAQEKRLKQPQSENAKMVAVKSQTRVDKVVEKVIGKKAQEPAKIAKERELWAGKTTTVKTAAVVQPAQLRTVKANESESSQTPKAKLPSRPMPMPTPVARQPDRRPSSGRQDGSRSLPRGVPAADKAAETTQKSQSDLESEILSKLVDYNKEQSLLSGQGLLIFDKSALIKQGEGKEMAESPVWSEYNEKEFAHQQQLPHQNAFEEMIDLTNQGKLWHFPINNEQGIDESDANVPFFEHVFLEHHLEQFPDIEPIQEFMTLVLNGLSKNSFMSVAEKRDVIQWYKSYFDEKLDVIKESLEVEKNEAAVTTEHGDNDADNEQRVIKKYREP